MRKRLRKKLYRQRLRVVMYGKKGAMLGVAVGPHPKQAPKSLQWVTFGFPEPIILPQGTPFKLMVIDPRRKQHGLLHDGHISSGRPMQAVGLKLCRA